MIELGDKLGSELGPEEGIILGIELGTVEGGSDLHQQPSFLNKILPSSHDS